MNQDWFRKILAKQKSSSGERLLFGFLCFASVFYRFGIYIRGLLYKSGLKKSYKADKPVISIGNITTGGTGKTPLVIWVCNYLAEKKQKCGVLTRGYKAGKGIMTDEPAMLAKACKGTNVIIDADRVKGAARAVKESGCDVLVMDDGFQHIRLKRDINILTIDATCPFGFDRLLPAGLLREPLNAIKRADAVLLTRTDQADDDTIRKIEEKLSAIKKDMAIAKTVHRPLKVVCLKNEEFEISALKEKKVYAFCGIGNPNAFFKTLELSGIKTVAQRIYNDHYNFSEQDLRDIYEEARYLEADIILSSQKDWVKTALFWDINAEILFGYLAIELLFTAGQDKIEQLINGIIQKTD